MKIGFGSAVITPPVGSSLVGYFQDRRSKGIRDQLYATAWVLEEKEEKFAVITLDLVSIDHEMSRQIRRAVSATAGIPEEKVMVHAVHTHTGPPPRERSGFHVDPCYLELLPAFAAGSVLSARENATEALVGTGESLAPGIAFNRRYLMKDGCIVTNPWNRPRDIVRSAGPVDRKMRLLEVRERETGRVSGLVVNFALHPDTLGDNLISADWPGFLRRKLRRDYPGAEIMILNGPSGDINHIDPEDPGRRGVEVPEQISETLRRGVKRLVRKSRPEMPGSLETYRHCFSADYRPIKPEELSEARKILAEKKIPVDSLKYMASGAITLLAEESSGGKKLEVEVNGFSLGETFACLGMPGEIFTEIGRRIRKVSPFRNTMIAQNCHSKLSYVPSGKAFRQDRENWRIKPGYGTHSLSESFGIDCSYETTPISCKIGVEAEKVFVNAADSTFRELKSSRK